MEVCVEGNSIGEDCELVGVDEHYESNVLDYHPVTHKTVYGSEAQRKAIGESMKEIGQKEPILLWKKNRKVHVVDGRNRLSGAKLMGEEEIWAKYISSNTTRDELDNIVNVSRTRVHETPSQLAVGAYMLSKEKKNVTLQMAADIKAVSVRQVKYCSKIDKYRPKALEQIFATGSYAPKGEKPMTSLAAIAKYIEQEDKPVEKEEKKETSEDQQKMAIGFTMTDPFVETLVTIIGKEHASKVLYAASQKLEKE